ncbi:MAG: DUF3006 domain-containing protein [Deltaproteobacteria bacterium]|nr:MAG: DUF3006 domain-containing protein [Deltaproteobacteria bacterium]
MPDATIAIDRIEGPRAILDVNGELIEVPTAVLPPGAVEGSLLTLQLADGSAATLDAAEARIRRLASPDLPDDVQL